VAGETLAGRSQRCHEGFWEDNWPIAMHLSSQAERIVATDHSSLAIEFQEPQAAA